MSTKPTPKKKAAKRPLKPQQQNPFAAAHQIVMQTLEQQSEFLIDWRKRMDDHLTAIESKLSTPSAAPKEAEQPKEWVPKVGDWVMPSDKFITACPWAKEFYPNPMLVLSVDGEHAKEDNTDSLGWHISNIRPATESEITAHKEKQAKQAEADKLAKLKWATPVMTPDGEGIFLDYDKNDKTCWTAVKPEGNCEWIPLADITLIEP